MVQFKNSTLHSHKTFSVLFPLSYSVFLLWFSAIPIRAPLITFLEIRAPSQWVMESHILAITPAAFYKSTFKSMLDILQYHGHHLKGFWTPHRNPYFTNWHFVRFLLFFLRFFAQRLQTSRINYFNKFDATSPGAQLSLCKMLMKNGKHDMKRNFKTLTVI